MNTNSTTENGTQTTILGEKVIEKECLYFQLQFQFTFWLESELAPILQRWIDKWLIIILALLHFQNIVTMQDTMAVQMSKVKKIYLYIKNINYYVFQGMQKRKQ